MHWCSQKGGGGYATHTINYNQSMYGSRVILCDTEK